MWWRPSTPLRGTAELVGSLFHGLGEEALASIRPRLQPVRFLSGETVIAQGDLPRRIFILQSGTAQVSIARASAGEEVVRWVAPGATLGEISMLTGQPATATVRAITDLEVLGLSRDDFHEFANAFPDIHRNLGTIISERMVQDSAPTFRHHDRITILLDFGAPPTLGYALASSMAWHVRRNTVLVVLDGGAPPAELLALARATPSVRSGFKEACIASPGERPEPRADLLMSGPDGPSTDQWVSGKLTELTRAYEHVLIQVRADRPLPLITDRIVALAGASGSHAVDADDRFRYTVQGWTGDGRPPRPTEDGILHVPALRPNEEASLRDGLLPSLEPGGAAIGWAARDLADLKVGIAFGGGSVLGYAHLGVMQVLERAGLRPDFVAGTSIGAPLAALCSLEYGPAERSRIIDTVGRGAFRPTLPFTAVMSSSAIVRGIRDVIGDTRIEDMPIPFAAVAADLISGRAIALRRGPLWKALMASMSIPGIYSPQRIGPHLLVDGGLLDPVPTGVVAEMGADTMIGVKLNPAPTLEWGDERRRVWLVQVLRRSLDMMQSQIASDTADKATIMIEAEIPNPGGVGLQRFTDGRRFIEFGEAAAEAALPRLVASLPWLQPIR